MRLTQNIAVAAILAAAALLFPGCSGVGPSGISEDEQDLGRWLTLDPRVPFELRVGASRHLTVDAGGPVRRLTWAWDGSELDVAGIDCEPADVCSVESVRQQGDSMYATVVLHGARRVGARIVALRPGFSLLGVYGYSRGPCEGPTGPFECGPEGGKHFFVDVVP